MRRCRAETPALTVSPTTANSPVTTNPSVSAPMIPSATGSVLRLRPRSVGGDDLGAVERLRAERLRDGGRRAVGRGHPPFVRVPGRPRSLQAREREGRLVEEEQRALRVRGREAFDHPGDRERPGASLDVAHDVLAGHHAGCRHERPIRDHRERAGCGTDAGRQETQLGGGTTTTLSEDEFNRTAAVDDHGGARDLPGRHVFGDLEAPTQLGRPARIFAERQFGPRTGRIGGDRHPADPQDGVRRRDQLREVDREAEGRGARPGRRRPAARPRRGLARPSARARIQCGTWTRVRLERSR